MAKPDEPEASGAGDREPPRRPPISPAPEQEPAWFRSMTYNGISLTTTTTTLWINVDVSGDSELRP